MRKVSYFNFIPLFLIYEKISTSNSSVMKKCFFAIMPWLFAAIGYKSTAQDIPVAPPPPPPPPAESREIIIRKNGDKDTRLVLEFKDDSVLINGKTILQFNDDQIVINDRTIRFNELARDANGFARDMNKFRQEIGRQFQIVSSGTFLGVMTEKADEGARIAEVIPGSPAEKAGLKPGDIIIKLDNDKIAGPKELAEAVQKSAPGKEVKVFYKRDKKEKSVKVKVEKRSDNSMTFSYPGADGLKTFTLPEMPQAPNFKDFDFRVDGFSRRPKLGLKVQDLEDAEGVKVLEVEPGSAAATAGLQPDDVITAIDGEKVSSTDDLRDKLKTTAEKTKYMLQAKRNNSVLNLELKLSKPLKTANL